MWNKRKLDNVIAVKSMPYIHTVVCGALDLTCVLSVHTVRCREMSFMEIPETGRESQERNQDSNKVSLLKLRHQ